MKRQTLTWLATIMFTTLFAPFVAAETQWANSTDKEIDLYWSEEDSVPGYRVHINGLQAIDTATYRLVKRFPAEEAAKWCEGLALITEPVEQILFDQKASCWCNKVGPNDVFMTVVTDKNDPYKGRTYHLRNTPDIADSLLFVAFYHE